MPTLNDGIHELRQLIDTSRARLQALAALAAPTQADTDEIAWLMIQVRGQEKVLSHYETEQRWPSDL